MKVDYSSMSDFEVNKMAFLLASKAGVIKFEDLMEKQNPNRNSVMYGDGANWHEWDGCNNPADAWPIIIENNISINHEIARYKASALVYDVKYERGFNIFVFNSVIGDTSSRSALRAAMIVFLMMNEQ